MRRVMVKVLAATVMLGIAAVAVAQNPASPNPVLPAQPLPKTQHWIGVAVENIPPTIAKQLKLKSDQGLMVVSVLANSPAAKADVRAEDLLIEVNGKPLLSQEQLASAANQMELDKAGAPRPKTATLTFLREGDRRTIEVTPEPRPASMLVIGGRLASFQPSLNNDGGNPAQQPRTIAFQNGQTAQVHQGYRIDLNANPQALTNKSIKSIVSQGKTIVLTQETSGTGAVKNYITVDQTTHEVTPKTLDRLPPEVRPLAEEMLKTPQRPATQKAEETTDGRLEKLERENKELKDKLDRMLQLLEQQKK